MTIMSDRFLESQVLPGIREGATREKLLQGRDLPLVKCLDMTLCRAAESASAHKTEMSGNTSSEVNRPQGLARRSDGRPEVTSEDRVPKRRRRKNAAAVRGRWYDVSPGVCPALDEICSKDGQRNHALCQEGQWQSAARGGSL